MAVIISEFEIVPEEANPRRDQREAPRREAAAARPLRPDEVVLITRHDAERRERVRAD